MGYKIMEDSLIFVDILVVKEGGGDQEGDKTFLSSFSARMYMLEGGEDGLRVFLMSPTQITCGSE